MQLTALRHRNERRPCRSYAYMSSCLLTLRRPEYRPPKQERKLAVRMKSGRQNTFSCCLYGGTLTPFLIFHMALHAQAQKSIYIPP